MIQERNHLQTVILEATLGTDTQITIITKATQEADTLLTTTLEIIHPTDILQPTTLEIVQVIGILEVIPETDTLQLITLGTIRGTDTRQIAILETAQQTDILLIILGMAQGLDIQETTIQEVGQIQKYTIIQGMTLEDTQVNQEASPETIHITLEDMTLTELNHQDMIITGKDLIEEVQETLDIIINTKAEHLPRAPTDKMEDSALGTTVPLHLDKQDIMDKIQGRIHQHLGIVAIHIPNINQYREVRLWQCAYTRI